MKFKWNRKLSIFVLFMFITVTFASFNTNLFINGKAYVRVDEAIRIVDIHLLDTEYDGYETMDPEFNKNEITMDANLPKQNSSVTYQVSIQNTYPYYITYKGEKYQGNITIKSPGPTIKTKTTESCPEEAPLKDGKCVCSDLSKEYDATSKTCKDKETTPTE